METTQHFTIVIDETPDRRHTKHFMARCNCGRILGGYDNRKAAKRATCPNEVTA